MLKKLFIAFAFASSMVLAQVAGASMAVAQSSEAAQLQAEVETLILQNAEDEAALEAAVADYVANAANKQAAAEAVIAALSNPQNSELKIILEQRAGVAAAAGNGLGAAIAQIAVTDPATAANIQAAVKASGNENLASAVNQGFDNRASSIQSGVDTGAGVVADETVDTTPEQPVSPSGSGTPSNPPV